MREELRVEYRGISFHISRTGHLLMDDVLPPCYDGKKRQWSDMFMYDDMKRIMDRELDDEIRIRLVKKGIDLFKGYRV